MRQAELRASYNVEFEVQRREFLNTMSLRHRSQETEEGTHWWDGVPQMREYGSGRVGVSGMFLGPGSGEAALVTAGVESLGCVAAGAEKP